MSMYSKGPWWTEDSPGDWGLGGCVFLRAESIKEPIAVIDYRTPYCAGERQSVIDACATAKSNARIMAAAPELLEALKAIISDDGSGIDLFTNARIAIAKAEGR